MLTTILLVFGFVFLCLGSRDIQVAGCHLGWVGLALWLLVVLIGGL